MSTNCFSAKLLFSVNYLDIFILFTTPCLVLSLTKTLVDQKINAFALKTVRRLLGCISIWGFIYA